MRNEINLLGVADFLKIGGINEVWAVGGIVAGFTLDILQVHVRSSNRLLKKGRIHYPRVFIDVQARAGPSGRALRLPK